MEHFKSEDYSKIKFDEIRKAKRETKLCFSSKFLVDLHDQFLDVIKFHNEPQAQTPLRSNAKRIESTPKKSSNLNKSFFTSTPEYKQRNDRNAFHQNKIHALSPFSTNTTPPSSDRYQKQKRLMARLGDYCPKNKQDDGHSKSKNKNSPRPNNNGNVSQTPLIFNLQDDEFPSISEALAKPKRRLPTTVVSTDKIGTKDLQQSFAPAPDTSTSFWARIPQSVDLSGSNPIGTSTQSSPQPIKLLKTAEPVLENVTDVDDLNMIADFYSYIINEGMTPSIINELYMVIQLITINVETEKTKTTGWKQFSTLSNIIYFSSRVLQNLSSWLELLDDHSLKLLSENDRLRLFAPEFFQNLSELIVASTNEEQIQYEVVVSGGINFNEDTDTRSNFPSNNAFNIFKKQRDLFYQLLRDWEKEHLNWSMRAKADIIHSILIGCQPTLTDQLRFVRLFVSQLIKTCCSGRSDKDNSQLNGLLNQQMAHPDKLKKLESRFDICHPSNPQVHPSFSKSQEFFQDFISLSSDNSFLVFLVDALYAKIGEMSESTNSLILDSSTNCDTTSSSFQSGFLTQMVTLKILGKFLGFVSFLPYTSDESLTKIDEAALISMRDKLPDRIPILSVLKRHIHEGSLVVCLPWVLNYLSFMDSTAVHLQSTQNIFNFLIIVHHTSFEVFSTSKSSMFALASNMIGWFFELDIFPKELLYKNAKTFDGVELERLQTSMDHGINISREVIHRYHPMHNGRIQYLLHQFNRGHKWDANSKPPSRIYNIVNPKFRNEEDTSNDVKKKLEASFFQMQSSSLKKCVEFVCETVFSNWVFAFQNKELKSQFHKARMFAAEVAANLTQEFDEIQLISLMIQKSEGLRNELIHGDSELLESCCEKAQQSLANLIPESISSATPQVIAISTSICRKNIEEKVSSWKRGNINSDSFLKEITTEMNKQFQLYGHLSRYLVHQRRSNKSFGLNESIIEAVNMGDGGQTSHYRDESLSLSVRSTNSKVVDGSCRDIDDGKSWNSSRANNTALSTMSLNVSHLDLSSSSLANKNMDKSSRTKARDVASKRKMNKIKEDGDDDDILPSEMIKRVQDLFVSISTNPSTVESSEHVCGVLGDVRKVLSDPQKILHDKSKTLLQTLTVSLTLLIILEKEALWTRAVESEMMTIWREGMDSESFEELLHASHKHPILISMVTRLVEDGIVCLNNEAEESVSPTKLDVFAKK